MARWTEQDIPSQDGQIAVVTGANTGIGFEAARALAQAGARVILACRNPTKGEDAVARIQALQPKGSVELELLDLSNLESIAAFSARLHASVDRLDLLILNAGVMVPPASKTQQGFELQFGVNHLGHFALTAQLFDLVSQGEASRIVVLSSSAARMGKMQWDDLQFEGGYKPWPAYGQSKLANQLFLLELQRRLDAAGSAVRVTGAHPGWTATDLQRTSGLATFLNPILAMKPPQGALPTLRAATDPQAPQGSYYGPNGIGQMRGYPVQVPFVDQALRPDDQARL